MSVKAKVQRSEGIPISQQHLIWNSQELSDDSCLHDYAISQGATLRLVTGMRGGPINTRRVPIEDSVLREVTEYYDDGDEYPERLPSSPHVTLLVYREGDQLNFYRLVDRSEDSVTPLTDSAGPSPRYTSQSCAEQEDNGNLTQKMEENAQMRRKMELLKLKLESLQLKKRKPRPPSTSCPGRSITRFQARNRHLTPSKPQEPAPETATTSELCANNHRVPFRDTGINRPPLYRRTPLSPAKVPYARQPYIAAVKTPAPPASRPDPSAGHSPAALYGGEPRSKVSAAFLRGKDYMLENLTEDQFLAASGVWRSSRLQKIEPGENLTSIIRTATSLNASCSPSPPATVEAGFRPSSKTGTKLPPVENAVSKKKSSRPRCSTCGKKTGLATSFQCRCGQNFCSIHRIPESHNCKFDFKSEGKKLLEQQNPVISPPKLPKI